MLRHGRRALRRPAHAKRPCPHRRAARAARVLLRRGRLAVVCVALSLSVQARVAGAACEHRRRDGRRALRRGSAPGRDESTAAFVRDVPCLAAHIVMFGDCIYRALPLLSSEMTEQSLQSVMALIPGGAVAHSDVSRMRACHGQAESRAALTPVSLRPATGKSPSPPLFLRVTARTSRRPARGRAAWRTCASRLGQQAAPARGSPLRAA